MTEERRGELVLTFLLVNHADQTHIYEIPAYSDPAGANKALEMIRSVLEDVNALLSGTRPVVTINYPTVAYRADHVIGVKIEGAGPEDIQEVVKRHIGFVQPSS